MRIAHAVERIEEVTPRHFVLAFLLLLHIAATCYFLPPTEVLQSEPLLAIDYPVHTHRVHMYREALFESGLPWGYDPQVSAGSLMDPKHDVGAKPMQVLGVLLPFLSAGAVVRIFLFLALLTLPLWTLLACRRLGFSEEEQIWVLLSLLIAAWLVPHVNGYWHWGLVSFSAASYFSIYVLGVFVDYLKRPTPRTYALLALTSASLFLLHILGPVIILPALLVGTFFMGAIKLRWRWLLFSVPVVVLIMNAFWFVPFTISEFAQFVVHPPGAELLPPPDSVVHQTHGGLAELGSKIVNNQLLLVAFFPVLGLATYGLRIMGRESARDAALLIGITCAFGLLLWFFASFVPVLSRMQPVRFVVPTSVFLSLPVGVALADITRSLRMPLTLSPLATAIVVIIVAVFLGRIETLDRPDLDESVAEFIQDNSSVGDRVLVQSRDGYRSGYYETKAFPLMLDREVLGSNFPEVNDPPQFLRTVVLGRVIQDWRPDELRDALERWGGRWAFTRTPEAHALFEDAFGNPIQDLGSYRVFAVSESSDRFMLGQGRVDAKVNRIELSELQAQNRMVVIRYRFHPGWQAQGGIEVHRFAVPEDPGGFIALIDPPESVTLHFDPWAMLKDSWPPSIGPTPYE